jgi:hypothetical protein
VSSVRPLSDRILVKRVDSESKTKGGVIIPDTAKEKPAEGLVVTVGPGAVRAGHGHVAERSLVDLTTASSGRTNAERRSSGPRASPVVSSSLFARSDG